jgi:hypothetical protein
LQNLEDLTLNSRDIGHQSAGLLIGSAPSVVQLRNFSFSGIRIGIGDMPWRAPRFGLYDFWVIANGYYPLPQKRRHLRHIGKYCKTAVISAACLQRSSKDDSDIKKIKSASLKSNFVVYDERHFNNQYCSPREKCCKFYHEFPSRLTIQELLSERSGFKTSKFPPSHTAATYGLSLAVLLGLNPIFISGIELPRILKDYVAYKNWKSPIPLHALRTNLLRIRKPQLANDIGEGFDSTLEAFRLVAIQAKALGINIYCLSQSSALLTIPEIEFMTLSEAEKICKS